MPRKKSFFGFLNKDYQSPKFKIKFTFVFLHALFLIFLTVALQYTSFLRADEINFLKWAAIFKHNIFNIDPKPEQDNVVFIDISKDLSLTSDKEYMSPGNGLKAAQKIITDRAKLATLFSILNSHPGGYKFIICDILFEDPSPDDSILKPQIEKLKNVMVTSVWNNGLVKPIFKVPYSVVNYVAINRYIFTKMPVYYKGDIKSFPVAVYEKETNNKFTKKGGVVVLNGKPTFDTVIPEFYYRQEDLLYQPSGKRPINTYYLGKLLFDPDCYDVLKNKIIIIGDFKQNDMHYCYLGKLPGPLILWDTYLTLKYKPANIAITWLLMLYTIYFFISYWIILHPDRKIGEVHKSVSKKIKISFINKFIIKYISFVGILIIINIFSYFYFGTFISLFYIATYLTSAQVVIDEWPGWMKFTVGIYNKLTKKAV